MGLEVQLHALYLCILQLDLQEQTLFSDICKQRPTQPKIATQLLFYEI